MSLVKKFVKEIENNDIDETNIDEIKYDPLSDYDIQNYFSNAKIKTISDLSKYKTIDDLLPHPIDYCFVLYEHEKNNGHWCLVVKYGKTIEYFDSYATKTNKYGFKTSIDAPLTWNTQKQNKFLKQKPFLTKLLSKCDYDVIYNGCVLQDKKDKDMATCGRWCVLRLMTILQHKLSLKDFIKLIKSVAKETGIMFDDVVSEIINKS